MKNYTRITVDKPELAYFTSDPHFFHENVIGFCDRPFRDADEMNVRLIANWNAAVPQDGIVFVLGDVFWRRKEMDRCAGIMARLNGRKWLIAGNHDGYTRDLYLEMGFEDARDYLELSIEKRLVVCSHYPLLEWNAFYRGSWHLHGHVHGRCSHFSHRVMDVGVDANNYAPVSWGDVVKRLENCMELDKQEMRMRGDTQTHQPYKFGLKE